MLLNAEVKRKQNVRQIRAFFGCCFYTRRSDAYSNFLSTWSSFVRFFLLPLCQNQIVLFDTLLFRNSSVAILASAINNLNRYKWLRWRMAAGRMMEIMWLANALRSHLLIHHQFFILMAFLMARVFPPIHKLYYVVNVISSSFPVNNQPIRVSNSSICSRQSNSMNERKGETKRPSGCEFVFVNKIKRMCIFSCHIRIDKALLLCGQRHVSSLIWVNRWDLLSSLGRC